MILTGTVKTKLFIILIFLGIHYFWLQQQILEFSNEIYSVKLRITKSVFQLNLLRLPYILGRYFDIFIVYSSELHLHW